MRKSQVPKNLLARMEGLPLTFVVLHCLRMGVHRAMLIGLLTALIATSLTSCGDGPQSEEPAQPTQAPEPTATPMPTPEPTATPMPTPAVGADGVEGCEDVLTREHSLRDILTDEDLIRCLREELQ